MRSALKRTGSHPGMSSAEANDSGREAGDHNKYPARTRNWDYMQGTAIDKMLGIDDRPRNPILSGAAAAEYIDQPDQDADAGFDSMECRCSERLQRYNPDVQMPSVTDSGMCLGCGVRR